MGKKEELTYLSADGVHQIHGVIWRADGEPRGVVQIVHGICEYVERYAPTAEYLNSQGFHVVGNDHLGHGKTAKGPQEYGYFTDWWDIVKDVHTLRAKMGVEFPGLPYFLLGHSMGSFVARTYLIDYPGTVDGCVLSGTGQEGGATIALAKLLTAIGDPRKVNKLYVSLSTGAYNKKFAPNRTSADWISRDEKVVDAYLADPLCAFQTTAGMSHAMMTGLQYIGKKENLAKMDKSTPVYLYAGDQDPVGAMGEGVKKVYGFFQEAGCTDVTMKLYPGGRHEMHNELNKEEAWADLTAWLAAHIPAAVGAEGQRIR